MKSPTELHTQEAARFLKELDKAAERILQARAETPALEVCEWSAYIDGSTRYGLSDHGGYVRPTYHMWQIGKIFDRSIYIYEEASHSVWAANLTRANQEHEDLGTFQFAVSDPSVVTFGSSDPFIRHVAREDFGALPRTWTIDNLVTFTALLERFYTPDDLKRRIEQFLSVRVHVAESLLPA